MRGFVTLMISLAGACWRGAKVTNGPLALGSRRDIHISGSPALVSISLSRICTEHDSPSNTVRCNFYVIAAICL